MVACVPCGINSPINKGKANSATPLLPGVGEIQRGVQGSCQERRGRFVPGSVPAGGAQIPCVA